MTWLFVIALAAVVTGSGGTVLLRGDGPALAALCRRARARLARLARRVPLLAPHEGHHQTPALGRARVPAPGVDREQATPRPADPRSDARAVRAGASTTPGAAIAAGGTRQAPASLTPEAAPPRGAAAAPDPATPSAGPGQRPYDAPLGWAVLTDTSAWNRDARRIEERQFQPQVRETGAQAALVRPGRVRHEAWQDQAVRTL